MQATENEARIMLNEVSDLHLIKIIADAENWSLEKVYKMAHDQVHVEGYPWESFIKRGNADSQGRLPTPVRQELQRAFQVHMDAGSLKLSTTGGLVKGFTKWLMIGWVIYFILVILF